MSNLEKAKERLRTLPKDYTLKPTDVTEGFGNITEGKATYYDGQGKSAGYTLDTAKTKITYSAATTGNELFTVSGIENTNDVTYDKTNGTITTEKENVTLTITNNLTDKLTLSGFTSISGFVADKHTLTGTPPTDAAVGGTESGDLVITVGENKTVTLVDAKDSTVNFKAGDKAYTAALGKITNVTDGTVTLTANYAQESYTLADGITKVDATSATKENLKIDGSASTDSVTIQGGSNGNELIGGSGADSLVGGGGADSLWGGTGNDTLNGGAGNDTLTGGGGADTFVISAGTDTVTDYSLSDGDIIQTTKRGSFSSAGVTFSDGGTLLVANTNSANGMKIKNSTGTTTEYFQGAYGLSTENYTTLHITKSGTYNANDYPTSYTKIDASIITGSSATFGGFSEISGFKKTCSQAF